MDFTGAQAKIVRAFQHLESLNGQMKDFFLGYAYAIGSMYNAEGAEIELYATGYEDAPVVEWGVRAGDCLHNLRSALDHLIWQFALDHLGREPTETEARRIQFPIAETSGGFKAATVRPYISTVHLEWIDNFQPYHDENQASRNKLAVLARLNNVDKHRVVHAAALMPEGLEINFEEPRDIESYGAVEIFFGEPLKKGVPIGRITDVVASGPHPYIGGEGPTEFSVVFSDPTDAVIDKAPVVMLLGQLGEITDAVVSTAEATFSS